MKRINEAFDWAPFIAELEASPAARQSVGALQPGRLGVIAHAQGICRCIEARTACIAFLDALSEKESR
jgi:hypothetical protein